MVSQVLVHYLKVVSDDSLTDYFVHLRGYLNFDSGLKLSVGIQIMVLTW